jgi:hypothetical protein
MIRFTYILLFLFAGSLLLSGCKKFLNVVPVDNLSGNNYWQNKKDVEAFTAGIYRQFRIATTSSAYFPAVGDMRCSPLKRTLGPGGRTYITELATNDMRGLMKNEFWQNSGYFNFGNFTKWGVWYEMIQACNILFVQVDQVPDPAFTDLDKKKYRAEAVFLRNLAYLFLVRQFGDVPYFTEAYNEKPLPRMKMVEILNLCIADMAKYKDDLPWTYDDPSIRAIRAMRGAAIDLLMHLNMWAAGFDEANKTKYYTAVDQLGKEIMGNNSYELLPLEKTKEIFKGRTKEGLFEVLQSLNYGERFAITAPFSDMVLRYPNKQPASNNKSYAYFDDKYLNILYPADQRDKRKDYWFDEFMYATDGKFQLLKFVNIFAQEGEDVNPDDNMIVFRLPDAILLRAEAQAELGLDAEARNTVNIIRTRAGADPVTKSGEELKDAIFYERNRELMGEGHAFFDLVRTKRVLLEKYCAHPIRVEDFNRGAWAWPIDQQALTNNPYMTLNDFWK